MAGIDNAYFI